MQAFEDYAFVVSGKKRKELVKLLEQPRTPTELAKLLDVHANVVSRILKDLSSKGLVEFHEISSTKKTYRLTKKGELARYVLDNLVEPKTLAELVKYCKAHRNVISSILKGLARNGFVALLKSMNPARKFCQLTKKGEEVRERL